MSVQHYEATLIAFYGDGKPDGLKKIIGEAQQKLGDVIGSEFAPRPLHDIHATLVGLENFGPVDSPEALAQLRQARPAGPDVRALCGFLNRALTETPLTVQFGGFRDMDYALTSRGARPFTRSFGIYGDKVVLIGWPVDADGQPTYALNSLRRAAGSFGANHRYFKTADDQDPDAYVVIGEVLSSKPVPQLHVDEIRYQLAETRQWVSLSPTDLRVAVYMDTRLPDATTVTATVPQFLGEP